MALVLGLDTATRTGSCALARGGIVVREQAGDPSRPQASRLPGELMALLEAERVSLHDVDAYAVATGPGSFTGLRVGIATMQGLAFAAARPLIGVSALDALAFLGSRTENAEDGAPNPRPRVAAWIDAWRGEVFAALYEDGRQIESPAVESPERILARLTGPTVFIGDGVAAYHDVILASRGGTARIASPASPLLAGALGILATAVVLSGHRPPPHAIRPLYVRRPDAELARDAGRAG